MKWSEIEYCITKNLFGKKKKRKETKNDLNNVYVHPLEITMHMMLVSKTIKYVPSVIKEIVAKAVVE